MQIRIQIVRGPERPRSRRRRVLVLAAVAAALAAPLAYAAVRSDVFTDVPSTAADHDAINRVYNAGIMKPCSTSPMKFCPNDNLLRRGAARQYDYILGLSGTPGNFTANFRDIKAGNLLFAHVTSAGALAGGNAVSSSRIATGQYSVTFARQMTGCEPVVTAGFGGTPAGDSTRFDVTPTVDPSGSQVSVTMRSWSSGVDVDNGFNLIAVC